MEVFIELEQIRLSLLLEGMVELISLVLQHIHVQVTEVELLLEQGYLWKIWSSFNFIQLVSMDQGV